VLVVSYKFITVPHADSFDSVSVDSTSSQASERTTRMKRKIANKVPLFIKNNL